MKRYRAAALKEMTPLCFARDILNDELAARDPMAPVSAKLRDAISCLLALDCITITYSMMVRFFRAWEAQMPKTHLAAIITIKANSFSDASAPHAKRTFLVTSASAAFRPGSTDAAITAACIDDPSQTVRLDEMMSVGHGKRSWAVESCYIVGETN